MITYEFLQIYWWTIVSLLGGLLAMLMFVQGAQSLLFCAGRSELERRMLVNSAGRKWEFTFTTLVTFGGAFFASFPLFYSTSFGGAYWAWMLLLVSFVLQAVSYEFQSKSGNVVGRKAYRAALVFNGLAGPLLVGVVVSSFFTGSAFTVDRAAAGSLAGPAVISRWANGWHGLDLLFDVRNLVLGAALMLLARLLGALYMIGNLRHDCLVLRLRRIVRIESLLMLPLLAGWLVWLAGADGIALDAATDTLVVRPHHYLHTLAAHPAVAAMLAAGILLVGAGLAAGGLSRKCRHGIWGAGAGTVLTVMALLLTAGLDGTAYYPSTVDLQSSLTLARSASSPLTLRVMSVVSLAVPFVLAYIVWAWRAIDRGGLTPREVEEGDHSY